MPKDGHTGPRDMFIDGCASLVGCNGSTKGCDDRLSVKIHEGA
jgi:hypothetical protein